MHDRDESGPQTHNRQRFSDDLLYRGAHLYHIEGRTQAEVASLLGISRPSVSRLLAEARNTGIVHIEVRPPSARACDDAARALEEQLGLDRAWVTPSTLGTHVGSLLAPAVGEALVDAALEPGDAVVISSGATVHAVAQEKLPPLPRIVMVPAVGGLQEAEEYYQTNEITRQFALRSGATPVLLFAPAMPSNDLLRMLRQDQSVERVMDLWARAQCIITGLGAPPRMRSSLPSVLSSDSRVLDEAVGDLVTRPIDAGGHAVPYEGHDRLMAIQLTEVQRIPHRIAVAVGSEKVAAINAAIHHGYLNQLVTDITTARALLG